MKLSRLFAATAIGVSYPGLVGVVAAGILTFTVARVYAESAAVLSCSEPRFVACADATESSACDCAAPPCKCQSAPCSDGGTPLSSALLCGTIFNACAEAHFTACTGKTEGAACGTAGGRCSAGFCEDLVDASYQRKSSLVCVAPSGGDAAAGASAPPGASNDPPAGAADSGCASTPGSTTTPALAGVAATVGLLLLWRKRRRIHEES